MSTFNVSVDERLRLVTAVLAISNWAEDEQNQLTHAVHPQAKRVRHFLRPFSSHPAVNGANEALLNGVALSDLFTAALRTRWPDFAPTTELPNVLKIKEWLHTLADFVRDTAVTTQFWSEETAVWHEAQTALNAIFTGDKLLTSLAQLSQGELEKGPTSSREQAVTLMPNLIFPALTPIVATTDNALTLLLPPPKAVGESPPWPFDEDPGWVVATVSKQLIPHLLAAELAQLKDEQQKLAVHTAVAHCLTKMCDDFEAQAYLLRAKKEHNLPQLPILFARLQAEIEEGNGRSLAAILKE